MSGQQGKSKSQPLIEFHRSNFHANLLAGLLTYSGGIPSNADKASPTSVRIAKGILSRIGRGLEQAKKAGQSSGSDFEVACKEFLRTTFLPLNHLRPGRWRILPDGSGTTSIDGFEQYAHLRELERIAKNQRELRAFLSNDYTIKPDLLIVRDPEPDEKLNETIQVVGKNSSSHSSLRASNQSLPIMHASISCKWTLRSDRAQNARTEALNLMRNRKGRVPHIVLVTGEPMPGRLASIALGTGDIDCVYHFALRELEESVQEVGGEDSREILTAMVQGKRLKDISDLPLDLAV